MIRTAVALSVFMLSIPAVAGEWTYVTKHRHVYLMPPAECMHGEHAPVRVHVWPEYAMKGAFGSLAADGDKVYGASHPNPDGSWSIFLDETLPPAVMHDVYEHELAHVRGCSH